MVSTARKAKVIAPISKDASVLRLVTKLATACLTGQLRAVNPQSKSVTKPIRVKSAA